MATKNGASALKSEPIAFSGKPEHFESFKAVANGVGMQSYNGHPCGLLAFYLPNAEYLVASAGFQNLGPFVLLISPGIRPAQQGSAAQWTAEVNVWQYALKQYEDQQSAIMDVGKFYDACFSDIMKKKMAGTLQQWNSLTLAQKWAAMGRKYGLPTAHTLDIQMENLNAPMDAMQDFDEYVIVHNEVNEAFLLAGQPQPEVNKVKNLILCVQAIFERNIEHWRILHPNLADQTYDSLVLMLDAADKGRKRPTQPTVHTESYTGSVAVGPPVVPAVMSVEMITALSTSVANAILAAAPAPNNSQPWTNRGGRGGQARGNGRQAARGRGNAGRDGRGRGPGRGVLDPFKYCHTHGWQRSHLSSECNRPYTGHIFQDGVICTQYHDSTAPVA